MVGDVSERGGTDRGGSGSGAVRRRHGGGHLDDLVVFLVSQRHNPGLAFVTRRPFWASGKVYWMQY